ncbi:MAG: hypothetical protein IAE79_24465 [Anaerolinea sp.]|nr:hypothetical protein [Anaerolinea sp.]
MNNNRDGTIERRLSSKLILTFMVIILATAVAAGALAYWLIATELEQQAWIRVRDGQRTTLALLDAERERLDALVTLTVQGPTLRQFLRDHDIPAMNAYVEQYQESARVDLLLIHDAAGELLARGETAVTCAPSYEKLTDYCLFLEEVPLLTLFGGNAILDDRTGQLLGYVTIGRSLNNNFAQELAAKTGIAHSFVVESRRVASSLPGAAPDVDTTLFNSVMHGGGVMTGTVAFAGNRYYTLLYPLRLMSDDVVALGEIAMPINRLVTAKHQILLTLAVSTLLIAAAGSVAALTLRNAVQEEALHHLRSYFLASITHEFRTPLSALHASVEFLVDEMAHLSRAEINELLHSIRMSVTGLQTLIDNLLESVRIEAGQFAIHPGPMELDEVVHDAVRMMQPLLSRRQQELVVTIPSRLPLVWGDPTRLIQVLVNLLANASKYGPMGQIIHLTADLTDEQFVRVSVADQGSGISPAVQEQLFRRFARFDKPGGAQHGLGLGLWVVRVIVTAHGGTVGLTQCAEGGSIFWFTLLVSTV